MTHTKTQPLSLRQNTLWNALGCMFYLGCQWLTTILVVTLSDDFDNSGALAFAMATGIVFASIALYKVRTFQVSDVGGEFSGQNYVAFRFVTILAAFIVCVIYLSCIADARSYLALSLLYLIFKADESFADVLYGIEQCHERMDYIGKSQFIRGIVSLAGFAIPLMLTDNLAIAIICMALSCMMVTLFYDIPHARLFEVIRPRISKAQIVHLGGACFLAMLASLCANAIVSLVRQYFGIVDGQELLGIYASVATPAVLVQVAATYLYSPMIGSLAKTRCELGRSAFLRSFFKILGLLAVVITVVVAALSIIGDPLLNFVFGTRIAPYTYLFPYVLASTGVIGLLFYVNDVLIIVRRMRVLLVCDLISLGIALGSAVVLIPMYEMNGINIAIIVGAGFGVIASIAGVLFKGRSSK
ncbi:MAG: hypothetical protein LKF61_05225 [Eggerthellaceae bacterium]|jgi:O-antigen/teichoic acid export membrane protein|nr:hypothetical protein [Eggerthellaceae bacterium]MCH4221329.1 hypothetical protein [Eggerthellaceae bacterium]